MAGDAGMCRGSAPLAIRCAISLRLRQIIVELSFLVESHLAQVHPDAARMFAILAFELFGDPEHRPKYHGAIIAGQVHDSGLDDEAAEFNQMPRTLSPLDLPSAHIMPRPRRLMPVAC